MIIALALVSVIAACDSYSKEHREHTLVGEWDAHLSFEGKPYVFMARFRADGSYDGFMDGKAFVSGKYRTQGDSMYITDGSCNINYEGLYQLIYFDKDSLRFNVLADTCKQRVEGTSGLAVKRIK